MNTVVFEIPLVAGSAHHRENLSALDRIVSDSPEKLIIKLLGPGGLAPEAILAYYDILGTLPDRTEIITISYSNLIGADLVLFVLGSPRDIRPNAWCYVFSSPSWAFDQTRDDCNGVGTAVAHRDHSTASPLDWRHLFWDYEKCLELISQHVELNSILDRKLEVDDLKEHLLIDSGIVDALLLRQLGRGEQTQERDVKKRRPSRRTHEMGRKRIL
jgi:hypothetical protein